MIFIENLCFSNKKKTKKKFEKMEKIFRLNHFIINDKGDENFYKSYKSWTFVMENNYNYRKKNTMQKSLVGGWVERRDQKPVIRLIIAIKHWSIKLLGLFLVNIRIFTPKMSFVQLSNACKNNPFGLTDQIIDNFDLDDNKFGHQLTAASNFWWRFWLMLDFD